MNTINDQFQNKLQRTISSLIFQRKGSSDRINTDKI